MAWIRACGGGSPAIPDGRTVTPINDVTIWQQCAGIANPTYTTLAEVLADNGVLSALMASDNAVDYLVRSKLFIGNTALVPTMTSDTSPSGVAIASMEASGAEAYKAFDGDNSTSWSGSETSNSWVGYDFGEKTQISGFFLYPEGAGNTAPSGCRVKNYKIEGSDDGLSWTTLTTKQYTASNATGDDYELFANYRCYRCYVEDNYSGGSFVISIGTLQFKFKGITDNANAMTYIGANNYCADTLLNDADWLHAIFESSYKDSVLNAQIPTMTSNNQPSGVASSTSDYSSSTTAFRAFDKTSNGWLSVKSQAPSYVEYAFPSDIVPKVVTMKAGAYSAGSAISDKLQMSKDDSTFVDIKICSVSATGQTFTQEMPGNTEEYRYFRVYCQNGQYASNGDLVYIEEFMVYGREDV